MKTIKSIIIGALVALVGSTAGAAYNATADLTMCVGDVLDIYETHGNDYNLTATSDRESVVTAARAANSVRSGKFFTLTAEGPGTATVTLTAARVNTSGNKMVFNITVNAARTVEVNGTANVAGWANKEEPGNDTWTSSVSPSGAVSVSFTKQSTSAMEATLTGKAVGDAQVTLSNVQNGNVGFKYIYAVKVGQTAPKAYDYKGYTITALGAEQVAVSGDDLVLRFTESGTMNVPANLLADILVVGGGGGGGGGYYKSAFMGGSTKYYANGGGGGEVTAVSGQELPGDTTFTVTVGKGGAAGANTGANGGNGEPSSLIGGSVSVTATFGAGGSGGSTTKKTSADGTSGGPNGSGATTSPITDADVEYGYGGAKASTTSAVVSGTDNTGTGGQGGGCYTSGKTTAASSGGAGGSGVVIVRFTDVVKPRTPIAVPTAAQGLVWGMTNQVGVAAGAGYVRGGTCEASAIGEYAATVTPDDDHCWADGKRDTRTIPWSIARRPATVTVCPATKAPNDPEPVFHTENAGFLAADQAELVWTAWRTNTDEAVGTYDIVILGEKEQSGYDISYVGNTLTIAEKPVGPTIPEEEGEIEYDPATKVVVVKPGQGVAAVEIVNMPADGTVKVPVSVGTIRGVEPGQVAEVFYTAPAGAGGKTYDITPAFTISGDKASGVTVALNGKASVTFDLGDGKSETVTVTPTLTETGDEAVEPFEVATEAVDVGVKTIPGLTYGLKRSAEPGTVRSGTTVDERQAEGLRTKLTDPMDGGRPEKAFYIIEVKK